MDDLNAATVKDVAEFFKTYYARTTLCWFSSATSKRVKSCQRSKSTSARFPSQPAPPAAGHERVEAEKVQNPTKKSKKKRIKKKKIPKKNR